MPINVQYCIKNIGYTQLTSIETITQQITNCMNQKYLCFFKYLLKTY